MNDKTKANGPVDLAHLDIGVIHAVSEIEGYLVMFCGERDRRHDLVRRATELMRDVLACRGVLPECSVEEQVDRAIETVDALRCMYETLERQKKGPADDDEIWPEHIH
ncbi:MAG: hypothetical protein ACK4S4_15535 [Pyrinomonadaceae bacterium]